MSKKIPKQDLINDLIRLRDIHNKIPSTNVYIKEGKHDRGIYTRNFGSWNNALMEVFGEVVRVRGPNRKLHPCLFCGKETKNPKFCSSNCAASVNNKIYPKREKESFCASCGKYMNRQGNPYHICHKCWIIKKSEEFGERIISSFISTYARHRYQVIRSHAKTIARINNLQKKCKICDYFKHAELCHLIPISKFPKNTKISVVNDITNLVYLCPTHHWEQENDQLSKTNLNKLNKID